MVYDRPDRLITVTHYAAVTVPAERLKIRFGRTDDHRAGTFIFFDGILINDPVFLIIPDEQKTAAAFPYRMIFENRKEFFIERRQQLKQLAPGNGQRDPARDDQQDVPPFPSRVAFRVKTEGEQLDRAEKRDREILPDLSSPVIRNITDDPHQKRDQHRQQLDLPFAEEFSDFPASLFKPCPD